MLHVGQEFRLKAGADFFQRIKGVRIEMTTTRGNVILTVVS